MNKVLKFLTRLRKSESYFVIVIFRYIWIKIFNGKSLLLHQNVIIRGMKNINTKDILEVGIGYVGFSHKRDTTYINIQGKLNLKGKYSIGRGCRLDIGESAIVSIGSGGYINCNTTLIIMHKLEIGDNCVISWNCQFLDEDFHEIQYSEKKKSENSIVIGNNVWIGCGVKIYKGSVIPDGCIVASDTIIKGVFEIENSLIAGSPAKVIKEKVKWN
jgi:acetyltransferase-like isoleucine patch superfamily enzyme